MKWVPWKCKQITSCCSGEPKTYPGGISQTVPHTPCRLPLPVCGASHHQNRYPRKQSEWKDRGAFQKYL